ncbi:lipase 3-like [Anopheles maculipalpis]|uniref:lipase 3-like n=1 Tax=Anopheles maculipalpis TaxID=1496333 RepID=UPI002158E198|nr:lipase 3-like [Anopheles maculipalpis]
MAGQLRTTVVPRLIVLLFVVHRLTASAFNGTHDKVEITTTVPTTPATVWRRPPIAYDRDLVIELIEASDYPIEKHVLTTSDGYILKLHRIPDPVQFASAEQGRTNASSPDPDELLRFTPAKTFRGTVLLVPGLFSTAADFVVTGPDNGLAFVLADAGYDVWLANVRGSRFSRKNVKISVADPEFWDFSFHEIGTIDLAAIIDYILRETNAKKIFYVGHNQGMTDLFVLLSAKPRYNRKIHHAVGLASIAYLGTTENRVVRRAADLTDKLYATLRALNIHELKPSPDIVRLLSGTVCASDMNELCAEMLRGFLGTTVDRSRNLLPNIVDDLLTSVSTRQLIHFGQLMQTKKFQQFDYRNYMINTQKYGQAKPPEYNLSRVLLPVSLFHGTNDFITSKKDALRLKDELRNVKNFIEIPDMNHIGFVYSDRLYGLVNRKIIDIFNQHPTQA